MKYNSDKSEVEDILNSFLSAESDFEDIWKNFSLPNAFDLWLSKYHGNSEEQAEAINNFQIWKNMTGRIQQVTDASSNLKDWIDETDAYKKRAGFFGRGGVLGSGYGITTQSFSLYDIYIAIKTVVNAYETKWKRKSDKSVAVLGQMIFGDSVIGKEFARMADESEDQRIKEYKSIYSSSDGHELLEVIYKSSDQDEIRACIDMALEMGWIQWDDPDLWRALMRLQSPQTIVFNIPEDRENLSYAEIAKKVKGICDGVWGTEVFKQWDLSLAGSLDKAKNSWEREFNDVDLTPGGQLKVLVDILKAWNDGDLKNADPTKYEYFLQRAFTDGKMNGQPDKRWFFVVKGLTVKNSSGRSLLSKNVLTTLTQKVLGNVPHFAFFTEDTTSLKKNGRIVPEGTPGSHRGQWTEEDIMAWGEILGDGDNFNPNNPETLARIGKFFYGTINQSEPTRTRVHKMHRKASSNADHDDAQMFFSVWNEGELSSQIMTKSDSDSKSSIPFWREFLGGFATYVKYIKQEIKWGDLEYGRENPGWKKTREKMLKELGGRLKIALLTTQALQGNYTPGERTVPLVFTENDWNSGGARESKNKINEFAQKIFERHGVSDKYSPLLSFMGSELGKTFDDRKKKIQWKNNNKKAVELFTPADSGYIFNSTEQIWEVLKNFS